MTVREARVVWNGDLMSGVGSATAVSSASFEDLPVSWPARTETPDGKTSPEELIAAAHASCFAMALSGVLGRAKHPPRRLDVRAAVTFEKRDAGWAITSSRLTVEGQVPGIEAEAFRKAAEDAKDNCPVSQALKGNVALSVEATLGS